MASTKLEMQIKTKDGDFNSESCESMDFFSVSTDLSEKCDWKPESLLIFYNSTTKIETQLI